MKGKDFFKVKGSFDVYRRLEAAAASKAALVSCLHPPSLKEQSPASPPHGSWCLKTGCTLCRSLSPCPSTDLVSCIASMI